MKDKQECMTKDGWVRTLYNNQLPKYKGKTQHTNIRPIC